MAVEIYCRRAMQSRRRRAGPNMDLAGVRDSRGQAALRGGWSRGIWQRASATLGMSGVVERRHSVDTQMD